jgi:hypothetical protein
MYTIFLLQTFARFITNRVENISRYWNQRRVHYSNGRNTYNRLQPVPEVYTNKNKQTNSVALSPRANYTDWATAPCWWILVPTFVDRGVSRGQRGGSPTVVNLSFLDRKFTQFVKLWYFTADPSI